MCSKEELLLGAMNSLPEALLLAPIVMTRFSLNPNNNTESHKLYFVFDNKRGVNIFEDKLEY